MKEKTYIVATTDLTCINFSIFPEMGLYFQRKYANISEKNCITLSPATVLTFLVSGSLILSFNRQRPICSPFNKKNGNRKSLWGVFNSDKGNIPIQIHQWNVFPVSGNEWREIIRHLVPWLFGKRSHRIVTGLHKKMSWKTRDRVLELGCGPGSVTTQVLPPRVPEDFCLLVGADLSDNMIQYASETYTHSKLKFTQFDLSKDIGDTSQLRPAEFDKIFSFFCVNFIPDQRYYLAIKTGFHS